MSAKACCAFDFSLQGKYKTKQDNNLDNDKSGHKMVSPSNGGFDDDYEGDAEGDDGEGGGDGDEVDNGEGDGDGDEGDNGDRSGR